MGGLPQGAQQGKGSSQNLGSMVNPPSPTPSPTPAPLPVQYPVSNLPGNPLTARPMAAPPDPYIGIPSNGTGVPLKSSIGGPDPYAPALPPYQPPIIPPTPIELQRMAAQNQKDLAYQNYVRPGQFDNFQGATSQEQFQQNLMQAFQRGDIDASEWLNRSQLGMDMFQATPQRAPQLMPGGEGWGSAGGQQSYQQKLMQAFQRGDIDATQWQQMSQRGMNAFQQMAPQQPATMGYGVEAPPWLSGIPRGGLGETVRPVGRRARRQRRGGRRGVNPGRMR